MVFFRDLHENGQAYLCVISDPKAKAVTAKHKFPVYKSLLRPDAPLNLVAMRTSFPKEMTMLIDPENGRPSYILKNTQKQNDTGYARPPMLGRRIINGDVRWGFNALKIPGESSYMPLYWEWTEDILARCISRLEGSNIYNAVYASLYTYDRNAHIIRAFCESWSPSTNTLHTEAGEWSISLWDLHKLGGLPISGHAYDETVPSFSDVDARDKDGGRIVSRVLEHLFAAYCLLSDDPDCKLGVRHAQWINFWCKRKCVHNKPPANRPREGDNPPKHTHNPTGRLSKKCGWTTEELSVFAKLEISDEDERKTTYLAAYLSCWLCAFVFPEEDRVIRPATFEVAVRMARGSTFSLAPQVLANIYHGLNKLTTSPTPSSSGSVFPAHYLYAWLAHYFSTHHYREEPHLGPLMVHYSGYQGARPYTDVAAHELIHKGSSFKASCLVLARNRCETIFENGALEDSKLNYVISLRTAYLPLRRRNSFILEPYNPTRFSRQFGFYQAVPGVFPQRPDDVVCSYDAALKHLQTLLFSGSHSTVMIPGYAPNWPKFVTQEFKRWWSKITIDDLREKVQVLLQSVDYKKRRKDVVEVGLPIEECDERSAKVVDEKQSSNFSRSNTNDLEVNLKRKRRTPDTPALLDLPILEKEASAPARQSSFDGAHERPLKVPHLQQAIVSSRSLDSEQTVSMCRKSSPERMKVICPVLPSSPTIAANSIKEEAILMMERRYLQRLKSVSFDKVKSFVTGATHMYEAIQRLGGDPTVLQAMVDVYADKVEIFLRAKEAAAKQNDEDVSRVHARFQSAKTQLDEAFDKSEDLKTQLSGVTEERVGLEKLLEARRTKELHLVESHREQLKVVSDIESSVASLQREIEELGKTPGAKQHLDELERNLEKDRESLDEAL